MSRRTRCTKSQRIVDCRAFCAIKQASGMADRDWDVVADFCRSCLPSRTSRPAATSDQTRWKEGPRGDVERMYAPRRFAWRRKSFPAERTYCRELMGVEPCRLLLHSIVMRKMSPSRLIACHVPGCRFVGNGIPASLFAVANTESDAAALS